ncbi:hypothetical protein L798_01486 [Zootermopsis nevadensis]|uniref:Uncharacterized protein n=1 Tax=Zootermopsis nevadensis TaxID=136037 RepID=A0A067QW50_ZOONE|nr:hypothetical protein L798_01486 [Zootermopsis nevadensis]
MDPFPAPCVFDGRQSIGVHAVLKQLCPPVVEAACSLQHLMDPFRRDPEDLDHLAIKYQKPVLP